MKKKINTPIKFMSHELSKNVRESSKTKNTHFCGSSSNACTF